MSLYRRLVRKVGWTVLVLFLLLVVFHTIAFVVAFWPFNETIVLGPEDVWTQVVDSIKYDFIFTTRSDGDDVPGYEKRKERRLERERQHKAKGQ
jgi:hypothetical protein